MSQLFLYHLESSGKKAEICCNSIHVGDAKTHDLANAGEVGSIPSQRPNIPHATAQPRD